MKPYSALELFTHADVSPMLTTDVALNASVVFLVLCAGCNSSCSLVFSTEPVMPMIPLGLKETKEIDFREPFKVSKGQYF